MKLFISLLLIIVCSSVLLAAKDENAKALQKAKSEIAQENYGDALKILNVLDQKRPDDPEINLNLGLCYLYLDFFWEEAIQCFKKAIRVLDIEKEPSLLAIESHFYLGQAYHFNYQFKEAHDVFSYLRRKIPASQRDFLEQIDRELVFAQNAIDLSAKAVAFRITNLGKEVNSAFDEHSPVVSSNEELLIFSSNRPGVGNSPDSKFAMEDIFQSHWKGEHWGQATNVGSVINSNGNDASISLSADGKTLFIYRNDGYIGNIYKSEMSEAGWTVPVKLPKPINTSANESHASLSADGQRLLFTSDRIGGFGGKDIYMVRKLPNGEWGKALNLGTTINTSLDEESPFLHSDGTTLYFCSMGHKCIGGFDIFKSELLEDGSWAEVVNVGLPVNTPDDDLFYQPTPDGQRVYYASHRKEGFGGADLYLIEFPENHIRSMAVISGVVVSDEGVAIQVDIEAKDGGCQESLGVYKANSNNGKYVLILPAGHTYKLFYSAEGFFQEEVEVVVPKRSEYEHTRQLIKLEKVVLNRL